MTRRFSIRRSGISQISAAIAETAGPLYEERNCCGHLSWERRYSIMKSGKHLPVAHAVCIFHLPFSIHFPFEGPQKR